MKSLTFDKQMMCVPVLNMSDGVALGSSSIAIFRKKDLVMEYLIVDVPGEESSQLLIRFKEIKMLSECCILISLDDNLPDPQGPLSHDDYTQLIGEDICIRPGTIEQIDKVVVDAETGNLISVTVGEEIIPAERFFPIHSLLSSKKDTELDRAEMILNKQQQQMEAWMSTLSQQMTTMADSMLRMEEYLTQKTEPAATEANSVFLHQPESSETYDQVSPHHGETVDHVSLPLHMQLPLEIEQDMETKPEQTEFNAEHLRSQQIASAISQDEHKISLESLLLGKLDHIEQTLDVLVSRESLHETVTSMEQEDTVSSIPFPEPEIDDKDDHADLIKQPAEEEAAGLHAESYSLKQPGAISEEDATIKELRIDSIIDEFKSARLDRPESKTGPQPVWSPDPMKTADTAMKRHSEAHQIHAAKEKVQRSASTFWKNSGSQVLGMSLFVTAYCMLTFFQIL